MTHAQIDGTEPVASAGIPDEVGTILVELDEACAELEAARRRLAELLPASATTPDISGQARVEFVAGLAVTADEPSSHHRLRQINAEAWNQAQEALINAHQKLEQAHRAIRARLES